jgi:peptidoglycan-associated lipoprotein
MMARKIFVLIICVIGLGLTSACSKSLLPPEVQTEGSMVESEMAAGMAESEAASDSSEAESGGIGADPQPDAGFFQEESLSEMDTSSGQAVVGKSIGERLEDLVSSSRDFGSVEQGMPGDGATGSFSAEPFGSSEGGSGMAGSGMAGNGMPGSGMAGSGMAGNGMPGNGMPGSGMAGNGMAGNGMPGSGMAGSGMAGNGMPGSGMPGDGATGSFSAEPFSGSGGGSGMAGNGMAGNGMAGNGMSSGDQEARRLPYRSSDSLKDIHFAFDRYELDDQSRAVLRENATYLKSHPESRIEIQGHCDERGTNNYNVALGQRRAHSTKSYLAAQGIDDSRIHIVSYGEEKPFCFDSNENCWWQNRRAHFLVAE